ncbi:MAG TPA: hypothetical protein VF495_25780, partial [Phenylobacterium sp.]
MQVSRSAVYAVGLAAMLSLAGGRALAAGTVVQTVGFKHSTLLHGAVALRTGAFDLATSDPFSLHFDRFDAGLGTLAAATWTLTTGQLYLGSDIQVSGEDTPIGYLSLATGTASVFAAGQPLSSVGIAQPYFSVTSLFGELEETSYILNQAFAFNVAALALDPFTTPGGVDAMMGSDLTLIGGGFASAAVPGTPDFHRFSVDDYAELGWRG